MRETALGVASLDLTFSAPKSVSVIWSQGDPELRAAIESAMLTAANAVLIYMTETKPVVMLGRNGSNEKLYGPAQGFAAAAALHVTARRARGERVPSPQLHVHGVLVGAERADGSLAGTESSALFKHGAPLEGGAAGRAVLARRLLDLGIEVKPGTGKGGRFFEVRGVPATLIEAMSARTTDVQREIDRIEAMRGKPMGGRERALVALKTREQKGTALPAEDIARAWAAVCGKHGFGPPDVAALRRPARRSRPLAGRRAAVREAIEARIRKQDPNATPTALRAIAFECAAGRLGLMQAHELLEEMYCLDGDGSPSAGQLRALEKRATAGTPEGVAGCG